MANAAKINMKHTQLIRSSRTAPLLLLCASAICLTAQAQQNDNKIGFEWGQILQANNRISACNVVWKRTQRINARSGIDPNQVAERARQEATGRGLPQKQIQEISNLEREDAIQSKKGRIINSVVGFVRVGTSVLANIEYSDPAYKSRIIEFSNGTDSFFAQTQVKNQQVHPDATLLRSPAEVLKLSASSYQVARLLTGIPLSKDFSISNPSLSQGNSSLEILPSGKFVVERKARVENHEWQNFDSVTFAKDDLYPLSVDTFSLNVTSDGKKVTFEKGDKEFSVIASDHKQYQENIWFPSKIIVKTPIAITEYTLIEAKFNDQVDPADLRLPAGLKIADERFGEDKMVNYDVKDGKLPSDTEVKAIIARDAQATQAKADQSDKEVPKVPISASLVPIGGLSLIGLGGLMLFKRRKED